MRRRGFSLFGGSESDLVGGTFSKISRLPVAMSGFMSEAMPVEIEVITSVVMIDDKIPS